MDNLSQYIALSVKPGAIKIHCYGTYEQCVNNVHQLNRLNGDNIFVGNVGSWLPMPTSHFNFSNLQAHISHVLANSSCISTKTVAQVHPEIRPEIELRNDKCLTCHVLCDCQYVFKCYHSMYLCDTCDPQVQACPICRQSGMKQKLFPQYIYD